jgi:GNAT superfamily N-acetyltransferase
MEIGSKTIALEDSRFVTFREAGSDDEPFLLGVYGSTRDDELALTNWDSRQRAAFVEMQFNAQQSHYGQHYPEGEHYVILVDVEAVGRLYVAAIETEVRILDITILPQHRNTGIGTQIIRALMAEAVAIGRPLLIYVESYNRSLALFARLGFVKSGENGYSYRMEWRAQGETA